MGDIVFPRFDWLVTLSAEGLGEMYFWTIIAAIAGVAGAADLNSEQRLRLVVCRAGTISGLLVLRGGTWWYPKNLRDGCEMGATEQTGRQKLNFRVIAPKRGGA